MRLVFLLAALAASVPAGAQSARLLPVGDPAYEWIARLHRHGHALGLNPTALPYTVGEVRAALDGLDSTALAPTARRWADRVRTRVGREPTVADGRFALGAETAVGIALATNDRLDPVRYTDVGSATLQVGDVRPFPFVFVRLWMESGPIAVQAAARHDVAYNDDPDGLDVVNRIMTRNEESYVGASGRFAAAYLGVFGQHWAPPGADALVLSDNPRPIEQIALRLGGPRLAVRSLVGELDATDRDGRFTGRAGGFENQSGGTINRWLALHRVDWRPSRKLLLSIQEGAVYSGENAGITPLMLLPTQSYALSVDNTPKNVEVNGFLAGALWAQAGRVTVQGQLLLDDVQLFTSNDPASVALAGVLDVARVAPNTDAGFALTAVTARTYNTDQPPGRYLYALRGIGLPETDYVHARLFADVYLDGLLPGLVVSPEVQALWQGDTDLRTEQVPLDAPLILAGTVERTLRAGARVLLAPTPAWWLRADVGLNRTRNDFFLPGVSATRVVALVEAGVRVSLGGTAPLGW